MSLPVTMTKKKTSIASSIFEIQHEFSFPAVALFRDELCATPWFSNSACEREDVYFRVVVDEITHVPGHGRSHPVLLQVCSRKQRDAMIKRETQKGEVCMFDKNDSGIKRTGWMPENSKMAVTMAFGRVSLMFSPGAKLMLKSHEDLNRKSFKIPLQHIVGVQYDVEPKTMTTMTFEAEVFALSVPQVAEAGAEELVPAVTTTAGAAAMLARLLEPGVLSDVTLLVGGEELRAHRCVLAAASPVFRRMFEHTSSAESLQGRVDVQGVRPEVMAAALRFLYGQEPGAALDLDTLCDLLVLAERYELLELKQDCDQRLAGDRQADPLQLFTLAVRNNAPRLREAAVKRIAVSKDRESIINSDTVKEVVKSHPDVAVELILKL